MLNLCHQVTRQMLPCFLLTLFCSCCLAARQVLAARVKLSVVVPSSPEGYHIVKQIGQGTNQVFLAESVETNSHVALKYVDPDTEVVGEERRGCTFQQHLFPLANKQGVRIMECKGWVGNWMIYGLVEGQELAKTPEASRCKSVIVTRLLEGVRLFAQHRILHRDLKPENIMVSHWEGDCEDIQVVFIDFGSAIGDVSESLSPEVLNNDTMKGRRSFAYAWTPPEVRNLELFGSFKPYKCVADLRQYGSYDVWGVGAIAYWLSHSSESACSFDKCLALDSYTCERGLIHGITNSSSCGNRQHKGHSLEDFLAREEDLTKHMLAIEPCCRPAAEQLLGGTLLELDACSDEQMSARLSVKAAKRSTVQPQDHTSSPGTKKSKTTHQAQAVVKSAIGSTHSMDWELNDDSDLWGY